MPWRGLLGTRGVAEAHGGRRASTNFYELGQEFAHLHFPKLQSRYFAVEGRIVSIDNMPRRTA